jgi:Zn-dependent protease with chaperone function
MVNRIWLLGIILAVPIIGFAVSEGIQAHFNSQLRTAILSNYKDADPQKVAKATLDDFCNEVRSGIKDICQTNDILNLMSTAAIFAGSFGVFLLICVRLAGFMARSNRHLLLWTFKPGLSITGLVLIGLVIIHAGIAMGAIYYGESILIGRIHVFIIGGIGLGALAGVIAIGRNTFSVVTKAKTFAIGKSVDRDEQSELWRHVDLIADKLDALKPENIVLGLDPNFYVTEAEVATLNRECEGRTLYCSLPLMRILSKRELDGIIGHELGHYKGLDTKFSKRFFPIYRGTSKAIHELQSAGGESSGAIALLPAIAIFSYFLESFSKAESKISRDRELLADQEGVKISDNMSVASALVKVHAYSPLWDNLQTAMIEALQENKMFTNASKTFYEVISENNSADILEGLSESTLFHPTDSHPPLSIRLKSLNKTIEDVKADALNINNADSIKYVKQFEELEAEVSSSYQAVIVDRLGIELDE